MFVAPFSKNKIGNFAIVKKDELIAFLSKFKWIDKYATFSKILPLAAYTPGDQKDAVTKILDDCSGDLIAILKQEPKPGKMMIKQIIAGHMDELARARVCQENKDFGYELFWYLGEKMGVDMKKSSYAKVWGYWKVESNRVKAISGVRKRKPEPQQA